MTILELSVYRSPLSTGQFFYCHFYIRRNLTINELNKFSGTKKNPNSNWSIPIDREINAERKVIYARILS
jgi:hypothetical protein